LSAAAMVRTASKSSGFAIQSSILNRNLASYMVVSYQIRKSPDNESSAVRGRGTRCRSPTVKQSRAATGIQSRRCYSLPNGTRCGTKDSERARRPSSDERTPRINPTQAWVNVIICGVLSFVAQVSEISESASEAVPPVDTVAPGKSSQGPWRCRACSCRDTSCATLDK
jgi:hypothetical protein